MNLQVDNFLTFLEWTPWSSPASDCRVGLGHLHVYSFLGQAEGAISAQDIDWLLTINITGIANAMPNCLRTLMGLHLSRVHWSKQIIFLCLKWMSKSSKLCPLRKD